MSKIFDAAIELQLDILRASEGTSAGVLRILRQLERELVGAIANADLTDWSRTRIERQLRESRALIEQYYDRVAVQSIGDTDDIARIAAAVTSASMGSAAVLPVPAVLDRLASNAVIQGAAQGQWWAKQADDVAFKFSTAVRQGIAAAETNQQIVQRVREVMQVSRANAAALVQTSTATIANDARQAVFDANEDIVLRYRAVATLDTHTCTTCAPLDGLEWTKAGTPVGGHKFPRPTYPLHFNCLTGDALVTATDDVSGVSKRWYDGYVIVIKTAANRKLTCTPNHPILTSRGWVAAGDLDVGGDVISHLLAEGKAVVDRHHEHMPTTIHDFAESFIRAREVLSVPVPVAGCDFHGDGIGSDVAVVYTKRFLPDSTDAAPNEHGVKSLLINRGSNILRGLLGYSRGQKPGNWSRLASDSIMRGFGDLLALICGGRCHSCGLLLTPVPGDYAGVSESPYGNRPGYAQGLSHTGNADSGIIEPDGFRHVQRDLAPGGVNAGFVQPSDNDVDAYAALAGDLLAGRAGLVARDQIIDVERGYFSGHVYNLETNKGWYVSNGIVTHNCRCLLIPVVLDGPPGGKRASTDGPVDASLTFDKWLERQTPERQNDILGPGRADLYRKGTITLSDLVTGRGRPLTIEQLKTKYN